MSDPIQAWVGQGNHVLGVGPDPFRGRGNFGGTCPTPLETIERVYGEL